MNVLIRKAKYEGNSVYLQEIACHIADLCLEIHADAVEWYGISTSHIIPTPSSPWRFMYRGFDHMRTIARTLRNQLPESMCPTLFGISSPVRRSYIPSKPQILKTAHQRTHDVPVFVQKRRITISNIRHVIIIDDVVTTGSTTTGVATAIHAANPAISLQKVAFAYSDFMHGHSCDRFDRRETWLSGRKYLTANEASSNRDRGFESLRLRT